MATRNVINLGYDLTMLRNGTSLHLLSHGEGSYRPFTKLEVRRGQNGFSIACDRFGEPPEDGDEPIYLGESVTDEMELPEVLDRVGVFSY